MTGGSRGGPGGGGAALGAAVFVSPGATLTVTDTSADNGQLVGGTGGAGPQGAGQAFATGFFLAGPTTFSVSSGTQTISGSIADSIVSGFQRADITKSGPGTFVLSATNDYTGLTTVADGTLQVNNSTVIGSASGTGSGSVTVQAGAKLGGTGRITPTGTNIVTIAGDLEPGAIAPGTLEVGNALALTTGSTLSIRLGGAADGDGSGRYSQVNMTNAARAVSLSGNVTLRLSLTDGFMPAVSNVFYLLTRADPAAFDTFFAGLPEGASVQFEGITGILTYRANWTGTPASSSTSGGNDVAFIVIPEPSTAIFLAGCTLMLLLRRRHADFKA